MGRAGAITHGAIRRLGRPCHGVHLTKAVEQKVPSSQEFQTLACSDLADGMFSDLLFLCPTAKSY